MMKIWVIGRGYPTPENRMWGSFEFEQAKLLARNGYDVSYIALTLSFFSRKDPRGLRVFEENGVMIYACSKLYFPGKFGIVIQSYEDRCWGDLLRKAAESGLPDIIHIHYPSMITSIQTVEAYRRKGARIYVTEHWSRVLINNLKQHELTRMEYYATHAAYFACVGKPLQDAVRKLVRVTVPMTIIPNIVSPVFFREASGSEKNSYTFICVGRLVPIKQFDVIIRQYKAHFQNEKNVCLIIVGSGPEKTRLEKESENKVCFTGEIKSGEVASIIAKSDALISFSRYETFAAPVAEAWASGKPVIVSDTSGIASYINDDLGMVVPHNSEEALGKAMQDIYHHRNKYDSDRIKQFATEHFSDKAILDELDKMYRS